MIFFASQLQVAFAIKKPNVVKPSADSVSLRPLFVLSPVKNAASYEYKLKSVDPSSGATVTVETNTVSSNEFRITSTLTAGTHYKMVVRAIDGSSTKSAKKKFYFQAEEKNIFINHSQLQWDADYNDYDFHGLLMPQAYAVYENVIAQVTAHFHLPDGAIITKFEVAFVDNVAGWPSFGIHRQLLSDGSNEPIGTISADTDENTDIKILEASNLNSDRTTIDNDTYQYQFYWLTFNKPQFHYAKITYID